MSDRALLGENPYSLDKQLAAAHKSADHWHAKAERLQAALDHATAKLSDLLATLKEVSS